jgi:two-component system, response regulator FlrC
LTAPVFRCGPIFGSRRNLAIGADSWSEARSSPSVFFGEANVVERNRGADRESSTKPSAERIRHDPEESLFLRPRSSVMRRLLQATERAAYSEATILLTGESGVGKTLLARQIHLWSSRRAKPFLIIDCARLSQPNPQSSAPGLEMLPLGVMNWARRLEEAKGGTVFLTRIDDLSPALQVEFARFVQQRTLKTGESECMIDVRIVATANRDLALAVEAGQFREDLFYRLNIISLRVSPLR